MPLNDFLESCEGMAEQLREHDRLTVVGHYDADGLASTAIAVKALRRAGIETDYKNIRQFDSDSTKELTSIGGSIVFVDMGSGQIELMEGLKNRHYVIDHHPPVKNTKSQLNPFFHGINGSNELSASGTCYFLAKALDRKNVDLSQIAIVGAVGDMMDLDGGLKGANREILKDGEGEGLITFSRDLRLFGRHSRPLPKMLEYCSEPILPGLTGNNSACVNFLESNGIDIKDGKGDWRYYVDLSPDKKRELTSALYVLLLDHHAPHIVTDMLIGEVYEFPNEKPKTELYDAKEFATVLNACGRHDQPSVGVELCMGGRGEHWTRARALLQKHREELRRGLEWVKGEGLKEMQHLYYFDASGVIRDTIVGVIAGMVYGGLMVKAEKPILGFATNDDGSLKVSARGTNDLVKKGLKLGKAMNACCVKLGGEGGGHDVAAGARIEGREKDEFLECVNKMVAKQLGSA